MTAEWRSINGYDGIYEVSSDGEVRSLDRIVMRGLMLQPLKGKTLSPGMNKQNGYLYVSLCRQGTHRSQTVHTLVAAAFIGPCPDGQEVRHNDGIRTHNQASNLLYGTRRENSFDRHRHGTSQRGSQIPSARLTEADVMEIRQLIKDGRSLTHMANAFAVSKSAVQGIRDGKTWAHLGPIERGPYRPVEAIRIDRSTPSSADRGRAR